MEATKNSNSDAPAMPVLCPTGCGFFGNPTFENYCSQCYRQREQNSKQLTEKIESPAMPQNPAENLMLVPPPPTAQAIESAVNRIPSPTISANSLPALAPSESELASANIPTKKDAEETTGSTASIEAPADGSPTEKVEVEDIEPTPPPRPVQASKSKCFLCRAKIPLAMQITNQCRCEYVFCKTHKHPDQHDCDFEYKTEGRAVLAKNNPKLDDNKGGRSFNRID